MTCDRRDEGAVTGGENFRQTSLIWTVFDDSLQQYPNAGSSALPARTTNHKEEFESFICQGFQVDAIQWHHIHDLCTSPGVVCAHTSPHLPDTKTGSLTGSRFIPGTKTSRPWRPRCSVDIRVTSPHIIITTTWHRICFLDVGLVFDSFDYQSYDLAILITNFCFCIVSHWIYSNCIYTFFSLYSQPEITSSQHHLLHEQHIIFLRLGRIFIIVELPHA